MTRSTPRPPAAAGYSRRDFVYGLGASLGSVALTAMLAREARAAGGGDGGGGGPLAPRPAHLRAKAKNCIFLMMEGGPSHVDTFDPKPSLERLHLKEFTREGKAKSAMESG